MNTETKTPFHLDDAFVVLEHVERVADFFARWERAKRNQPSPKSVQEALREAQELAEAIVAARSSEPTEPVPTSTDPASSFWDGSTK